MMSSEIFPVCVTGYVFISWQINMGICLDGPRSGDTMRQAMGLRKEIHSQASLASKPAGKLFLVISEGIPLEVTAEMGTT